MSLVTWSQSRREKPPPIWVFLCTEWLGLSSTKTAQFWQALTTSRWTKAVELRSAVLCRSALPHHLEALTFLAQHNLSPQALIQVLEDLVTERLLSPKVARMIEAHVLAKTTKEGRWK
jgi:hypothetical protein